jgi:hypothetical protein
VFSGVVHSSLASRRARAAFVGILTGAMLARLALTLLCGSGLFVGFVQKIETRN